MDVDANSSRAFKYLDIRLLPDYSFTKSLFEHSFSLYQLSHILVSIKVTGVITYKD